MVYLFGEVMLLLNMDKLIFYYYVNKRFIYLIKHGIIIISV